MATKPSLLYFPIGGRASAERICLFAAFGKDGWDNEMITFPEFMEEKRKFTSGEPSRLLSGGLPQLTLPAGGGASEGADRSSRRCYGQSMAILQYALSAAESRGDQALFKLYVSKKDSESVCGTGLEAVLRAAEAAEYAMECLNKCPQGIDDQDEKKRQRQAYAVGPMKNWMGILEKRLQSGVPFLLGNTPCYADYVMMMLTDMIQVGQFDYVEATYLDQFPKLSGHLRACKESEPYRAYVEAYGEDGGI